MKKLSIGLYVVVVIALMIWGYYQAIYVAPNDAMQGEIFRIIYYHVPSFAVAFVFFAVSFAGSICYLAFRRNFPNRAQICRCAGAGRRRGGRGVLHGGLDDGPIWGRRAWGIWWTWDRAADDDAGAVADLRELSAAAPLCRRAAGADAGRGAGNLWRARRADRVHVEPLVADAASGAGVRRGDPVPGWIPRWCGALLWNMLAWFAWGVMILAIRYRVERMHQANAEAEGEAALNA